MLIPYVLLGMVVLGETTFGRFEIELPLWKKWAKWGLLIGCTLTLELFCGLYALALPIFGGLLGLSIHFLWCKKNAIHPFKATPHQRYYQLRGWDWPYGK